MERKPGLDKDALAKLLNEFKEEPEESPPTTEVPSGEASAAREEKTGEKEGAEKPYIPALLAEDLAALWASHGLSGATKGQENSGVSQLPPAVDQQQVAGPVAQPVPPATVTPASHPIAPSDQLRADIAKMAGQPAALAPSIPLDSLAVPPAVVPPAPPPAAVRQDETRQVEAPTPPATPRIRTARPAPSSSPASASVRGDETYPADASMRPSAPRVRTAPPAKPSKGGILSRLVRRKSSVQSASRMAEPPAYAGLLEIELDGSPAPALLDRFQAELGQVPGLEYRGTWGSSHGHVVLHLNVKRSLSVLPALRRIAVVSDVQVAAVTPHLKVRALLRDVAGREAPSTPVAASAHTLEPGEATLIVSPLSGIAELLRFQGLVRAWPGVTGILKTATTPDGTGVVLTLSVDRKLSLDEWARRLSGATLELETRNRVKLTLPDAW